MDFFNLSLGDVTRKAKLSDLFLKFDLNSLKKLLGLLMKFAKLALACQIPRYSQIVTLAVRIFLLDSFELRNEFHVSHKALLVIAWDLIHFVI